MDQATGPKSPSLTTTNSNRVVAGERQEVKGGWERSSKRGGPLLVLQMTAWKSPKFTKQTYSAKSMRRKVNVSLILCFSNSLSVTWRNMGIYNSERTYIGRHGSSLQTSILLYLSVIHSERNPSFCSLSNVVPLAPPWPCGK